MLSLGLFIIRLVTGLTIMGHASQKLFGAFGGGGLKGTASQFESMGLKPGMAMALIAGLGEFIGGALFVLGLITPFATLLIAVPMLVAIFMVHGKNGFFSNKGGFEYNLILLAIAVGIGLTGPGDWSIDALIF